MPALIDHHFPAGRRLPGYCRLSLVVAMCWLVLSSLSPLIP